MLPLARALTPARLVTRSHHQLHTASTTAPPLLAVRTAFGVRSPLPLFRSPLSPAPRLLLASLSPIHVAVRPLAYAIEQAIRKREQRDLVRLAVSVPLSEAGLRFPLRDMPPALPSGHRRALGGTENLPFHVARSDGDILPVYSKYRRAGDHYRRNTIVRRYSGDIEAFVSELSTVVGGAPMRIRLGCVEVEGDFVSRVREWLAFAPLTWAPFSVY